jgi:hypothetical protein
MTARMGVAVTVPKVKQTILLANPPNFGLVLDVEIVVLGIIAEILDKTIGWWKEFLAILAEQKKSPSESDSKEFQSDRILNSGSWLPVYTLLIEINVR